MPEITPDDHRRIELLEIISKQGIKVLDLVELKELLILVEKKDYSHNKKAQKSKMRLLTQINSRVYDLEKTRIR